MPGSASSTRGRYVQAPGAAVTGAVDTVTTGAGGGAVDSSRTWSGSAHAPTVSRMRERAAARPPSVLRMAASLTDLSRLVG